MEAFEEKASPNTPNATPFRSPFTQGNAKLGPVASSDMLYSTPQRPNGLAAVHPLTGTIRRTAPRRNVTDREAMKQLADCVGMSARKKVLESGRKPKILPSYSRSGSWRIKELNFETLRREFENNDALSRNADGEAIAFSESESEGPPSPSPVPRPGSAMSVLSVKTLPRVASNPTLRLPDPGKNRNVVAKCPMPNESPALPQSEPDPSVSTDSRKTKLERHLEEKFKALMEDIEDVERRLATLTVQIKGEG
jgi:hypothetical protein